MSLLNFPNEILDMIAAFLDVESQIAFARVNDRLRNFSFRMVKGRRFTEPVLDHLRNNRDKIRTLDISNCKQLPTRLPKIIIECTNIRELKMVNTPLSFVNLRNILEALPHLELLSFSLTMLTRSGVMELGSSKSVKNLYVEVRPDIISLTWIVRLMNRLEGLRKAHVNLVGAPTYRMEPYCPALKSTRWETLHTFVCSCYLSRSDHEAVRAFLRGVFNSKPSPEVDRWLAEKKDCYIYEYGHVNMNGVNPLEFDGRVKLLEGIRSVDLGRDGERLRSPWRNTQSLRIRHDSPLTTDSDFAVLSGLLTSALVELDLTDCHGIFPDVFWRCLPSSSPCLKNLALPLCFFISPAETSVDSRLVQIMKSAVRPCAMAKNQAKYENPWLQGLRLQKLFLKAPLKPFSVVSDDPIVDCERCAQPLTCRNLPRLEDLAHLEELTFNNISFDPSALPNMASSKAHTIRLKLKGIKDFKGMPEFLARCENLRNLKLSGLNSRLGSRKLWKALAAAKNLRQLCLGASEAQSLMPSGKLDIHDILSQMPPKVESFHFHISKYDVTDSFKVSLFEYWGENKSCEFLSERILMNHRYSSFGDDIRSSRLGKPFLGRGLCHLESFAGYVKPVEWLVSALDA